MTKEVAQLRKALWQNMAGCECKNPIVVNGKTVFLKKDEMCTREWVRCNARMRRIHADFRKHGLSIGPVAPGASGLVGKLTKPKNLSPAAAR